MLPFCKKIAEFFYNSQLYSGIPVLNPDAVEFRRLRPLRRISMALKSSTDRSRRRRISFRRT